MQILCITPYYKPANIYGGPIVSISYLSENLAKNKNNITVYTTNANGQQRLPSGIISNKEGLNLSVHYHKLICFEKGFLSLSLIANLFRNAKNFDIVHIHGWWNFTSILSVLVCRLKGKKTVLSPRGMLSPYSFVNNKSLIKGFFHKTIGKYLLQSTYLHATALQEYVECQNLVKQWDGFIAPNIIDLPTIVPIDYTKNSKFKIIFLSRIHSKKGLEYLFAALSQISFEYELIIAGKGDPTYINSLKESSNQLDINKNITWLDWVSGDKKFEVLQHSDLMVLPSYNENFANVVLESLSMGTAVLISKNVGLSDYVFNNNLGWVVEHSIDSIKKGLEDAYTDKVKRQHIKQSASLIIQNDFSPQKITEIYIKQYTELIKIES